MRHLKLNYQAPIDEYEILAEIDLSILQRFNKVKVWKDQMILPTGAISVMEAMFKDLKVEYEVVNISESVFAKRILLKGSFQMWENRIEVLHYSIVKLKHTPESWSIVEVD